MYAIHQFFGVGTVNERANEGLCVYRVTRVENLVNVIIPHFMLYTLFICKQADFKLWQIIVNMMANGLHLTAEGFNTILTYYASINKGMSQTLLFYFPNIIPVLTMNLLISF